MANDTFTIKVKRWESGDGINETPAKGEIIYCTFGNNKGNLYIGDGSEKLSALKPFAKVGMLESGGDVAKMIDDAIKDYYSKKITSGTSNPPTPTDTTNNGDVYIQYDN